MDIRPAWFLIVVNRALHFTVTPKVASEVLMFPGLQWNEEITQMTSLILDRPGWGD